MKGLPKLQIDTTCDLVHLRKRLLKRLKHHGNLRQLIEIVFGKRRIECGKAILVGSGAKI